MYSIRLAIKVALILFLPFCAFADFSQFQVPSYAKGIFDTRFPQVLSEMAQVRTPEGQRVMSYLIEQNNRINSEYPDPQNADRYIVSNGSFNTGWVTDSQGSLVGIGSPSSPIDAPIARAINALSQTQVGGTVFVGEGRWTLGFDGRNSNRADRVQNVNATLTQPLNIIGKVAPDAQGHIRPVARFIARSGGDAINFSPSLEAPNSSFDFVRMFRLRVENEGAGRAGIFIAGSAAARYGIGLAGIWVIDSEIEGNYDPITNTGEKLKWSLFSAGLDGYLAARNTGGGTREHFQYYHLNASGQRTNGPNYGMPNASILSLARGPGRTMEQLTARSEETEWNTALAENLLPFITAGNFADDTNIDDYCGGGSAFTAFGNNSFLVHALNTVRQGYDITMPGLAAALMSRCNTNAPNTGGFTISAYENDGQASKLAYIFDNDIKIRYPDRAAMSVSLETAVIKGNRVEAGMNKPSFRLGNPGNPFLDAPTTYCIDQTNTWVGTTVNSSGESIELPAALNMACDLGGSTDNFTSGLNSKLESYDRKKALRRLKRITRKRSSRKERRERKERKRERREGQLK